MIYVASSHINDIPENASLCDAENANDQDQIAKPGFVLVSVIHKVCREARSGEYGQWQRAYTSDQN